MSLGNQEPSAYTMSKQQKKDSQIIKVPKVRPCLNRSSMGAPFGFTPDCTNCASGATWTPGATWPKTLRAVSDLPWRSIKPTDSGSFHTISGNNTKGTAAAKNMDCQPKRGSM